MNYIGSKLSLLEFIEEVILKEVEKKENLILCDIFSGTGVVGKYFKEKVYNTVIPRNVKLSEAPSEGLNIFDYDSHSEGAKAYAKLAKEVVKRNGNK